MLEGMRRFGGKVLLLLSGQDFTAREFLLFVNSVPDGRDLLGASRVRRVDLAQADHTFSQASSQLAVEDATVSWLGALGGVSLDGRGSSTAGDQAC